jgi:hypothetical protein
MRIKEIYLILASIVVFLACFLFIQLNGYYCTIVAYQVYTLARLLNNVGNSFALFDYFLFYACLDTLTMPIAGYEVYNESYSTAVAWGKVMAVDMETYFSYLLPCNFILFLVINLLFPKLDYDKISNLLKQQLAGKGNIGIYFIIFGLFFTLFKNIFPPSLMVISALLQNLQFVGPLYILFSNIAFKNYIFYGSLLFMFLGAIATGMFGQFLNAAALIVIVLLPLLKNKLSFSFGKKVLLFTVALFLVLVLQSIKPVYRAITWKEQEVEGYSLKTNSENVIFRSLMWDRITNPQKIFDKDALFGPYVRFNQGVLIAGVMRHVPNKAPYANGSTLLRVMISIIVPRVFYADKYEAGGFENIKRFLGITLKGYTMNIGPFGEMYGNFGPSLGLLFLVFFALIMAGTWRLVISMLKKNITWVLWISCLYTDSLSVETDIFTVLNSFIKNFLLVYVFLKLLDSYEKKKITVQ